MNRRDLLKAIPSISLTSFFSTEFDLRKQYMRYIFPSKYNIQSCESEGVKHYDAMYIDSDRGIQFHYYWDSKHQEHRTRIKVYGEDPLDIHTTVKNKADSITDAKEDLEDKLVVPELRN